MDKDRYARLMDLFDEACDRPATDQRQIVALVRASDDDMANRLADLLDHDSRDTDMLAPAAGARALADELNVQRAVSDSMLPEGGAHRVGMQMGDWVVGERIGAGGVGTVYRAHHHQTGQLAAIKFLNSRAVADPNNVTRLRREFRNVKRLQHRGCLVAYEEGSGDEGHYFVMEYASGGDLRRLIQAPPVMLMHVLCEVADALAYIHDQGIVHRDLKPANVLLTSDEPPQPKLADFGIAKVPDATAVITGTGAVLGSIDFLAPEQIKGKPADRRSDMYAFGCMTHVLWTGRPPFVGDNFERLHGRMAAEAPPLDALAPEAPAPLVALTSRLLTRLPEQRPDGFTTIAAELRAMAASPEPSMA